MSLQSEEDETYLPFTPMSGATNYTVTFPVIQNMNHAKIRCVVSTGSGSTKTSNEATLTVTAAEG